MRRNHQKGLMYPWSPTAATPWCNQRHKKYISSDQQQNKMPRLFTDAKCVAKHQTDVLEDRSLATLFGQQSANETSSLWTGLSHLAEPIAGSYRPLTSKSMDNGLADRQKWILVPASERLAPSWATKEHSRRTHNQQMTTLRSFDAPNILSAQLDIWMISKMVEHFPFSFSHSKWKVCNISARFVNRLWGCPSTFPHLVTRFSLASWVFMQ